MPRYDYNLVAIGAGAGGLVTTLIGAMVKAKVTLIEKHRMGGDCLNRLRSKQVADRQFQGGAAAQEA